MNTDDLERLAWRAKDLAEGIWQREKRLADKADFLAAFEHELFGTDKKRGRRKELREKSFVNPMN